MSKSHLHPLVQMKPTRTNDQNLHVQLTPTKLGCCLIGVGIGSVGAVYGSCYLEFIRMFSQTKTLEGASIVFFLGLLGLNGYLGWKLTQLMFLLFCIKPTILSQLLALIPCESNVFEALKPSKRRFFELIGMLILNGMLHSLLIQTLYQTWVHWQVVLLIGGFTLLPIGVLCRLYRRSNRRFSYLVTDYALEKYNMNQTQSFD